MQPNAKFVAAGSALIFVVVCLLAYSPQSSVHDKADLGPEPGAAATSCALPWPSAAEIANAYSALNTYTHTPVERRPKTCTKWDGGVKYGHHPLCAMDSCATRAPGSKCVSMSYGIEQDWSFDLFLRDKGFDCYLFDPTVNHPARLDGMHFFSFGASTTPETQREFGTWPSGSVPLMARALGFSKVDILKMDCEGCEFTLARDVWRDDCSFFDRVEQFALEVHLCAKIAEPREFALEGFGALLVILERAGLVLSDHFAARCYTLERTPPLKDLPNFDQDECCHNFLFNRVRPHVHN